MSLCGKQFQCVVELVTKAYDVPWHWTSHFHMPGFASVNTVLAFNNVEFRESSSSAQQNLELKIFLNFWFIFILSIYSRSFIYPTLLKTLKQFSTALESSCAAFLRALNLFALLHSQIILLHLPFQVIELTRSLHLHLCKADECVVLGYVTRQIAINQYQLCNNKALLFIVLNLFIINIIYICLWIFSVVFIGSSGRFYRIWDAVV